jgi:3'-5' exoribonuclease
VNDRPNSPPPSPRVPVSELASGRRLRSVFLVLSKRTDVTRAGDPYLSLTLGDKTGQVQARVWENAAAYGGLFEAGDFLFVDGFAETYRGEVQLRVQHLERVAANAVDEADFVRASAFAPDEMLARLRALLADVIEDAGLARLLAELLDDAEIAAALRRAPAAKTNHHAYLAGLLEHTLSLCELATAVGRHYERQYPGLLRTELLVAGALLHDLGKVWELSAGRHIEYTDVGNLLGHITLGVERLTRAAAAVGLEDDELLLRLKHMILSHHGEPEFGAVVPPKTPEAQVLHYLDQIDARLNIFAGALGGLEGGWTGWVSPLRRTLYAGPAPPDASAGEPLALPGPAAQAPPREQQALPRAVTLAPPPPVDPHDPLDVAASDFGRPAWAEHEAELNASLLRPGGALGAPSTAEPAAEAPFDLAPSEPEPVAQPIGVQATPDPEDDDEAGPSVDAFTLDLFG